MKKKFRSGYSQFVFLCFPDRLLQTKLFAHFPNYPTNVRVALLVACFDQHAICAAGRFAGRVACQRWVDGLAFTHGFLLAALRALT